MSRYGTLSNRNAALVKPKAADWDLDPMIPDLQVDGPNHHPTGLLDPYGLEIYRFQPPIGFGRDHEW